MKRLPASNFDRALGALTLAVAFYIAALLLPDYGKNWSHPDMSVLFWPSALRYGVAPSLADLRNSLDFMAFDGYSRARFLSHIAMIENLKLRLFLFQWTPPHPSFSWTWFPTLLLMPRLLFRTVEMLTGCRRTAWIGALLAVASTGTLSGVSMLFYPAKPLTLVALVASLYLAARASTPHNDARTVVSWRSLAQLSALITASLWLDETAFFIPLAVALFVPGAITRSQRPLGALALLFGVPFGIFAISTLLVPDANGVRFDFWGYALPRGMPAGTLSAGAALDVAWNMLSVHLAPRGVGWGGLAATGLFVGWMLMGARALRDEAYAFFTRAVLCTLLFTLFQARLMTRHWVPLDTFYYGSLFPVFFALSAAPALAAASRRTAWPTAVVMCAMLVVALHNFEVINEAWYRKHAYVPGRAEISNFPAPWKTAHSGAPLTRGLVRQLWEHRADRAYVTSNIGRLPGGSIGVWFDVEHLR